MIEDSIADPAMAGASREEQRRRVLFALEAPLPPPPEKSPAARPVSSKQRRLEALQKRMWQETDPQRRMDAREEYIALSRELND